MRKILITALAALLLLAGCQSSQSVAEEQMTGMANPFSEFTVEEEAEEKASFTIDVPQPEGYTLRVYRVLTDELIEVIYDGESEIRIRKAPGSGDISGDYNVYPEKRVVSFAEATITFEGSAGKVCKATWSKDSYAYSITVEGGAEEVFLLHLIEETF